LTGTVTAGQTRILVIAILASFVAFLDGSVVTVALPAISRELGGGLTVQQWVVDAYLITLGSLILIAGSLSDVFGRRRVLRAGLIGFGVTSLACALAPNAVFLIVSRAAQGVAGALLVPSSLAIIISTFSGPAQAKAIGRWTAWTGIAAIAGPVLGGFFVDTLSWRFIFVINVLPIVLTLLLMIGLGRDERRPGVRIDYAGAVLGALGLGGTVFGFIEQGQYGWSDARVWVSLAVGGAALIAFFLTERRVAQPMLSFDIFRTRNFWVGNIATALIYGALSFGPFILVLYLQEVAGYSAFAAGFTTIPSTLLMLTLSGLWGSLAGKFGARWFMAIGPVVTGIGFLTMFRMGTTVDYWTELLPGVVLFGLGLSITVAPLTSAVLGAIPSGQAGIASAVNNAVARVAGLVTVACAAFVVGSQLDHAGFQRALIVVIALFLLGGIVSAIGITNHPHQHDVEQ
jgi:EmrB/QacA subfamily drug resistance transporter